MSSDPEIWPFRRFRNHFKRATEQIRDRRFAWILGAGASKPSDIPTGGELVERWLKELYADYNDGSVPLAEWATAENLGIPGFRYEDAASFYPEVYEFRFRGDPQAGYSYLEDVMSNKEPCPGYSILAKILADYKHNVVVTTNFDNLVADALAIYTDTFPLVCGHESLACFVRPLTRRPLICKIHRDLLLGPQNDPDSLTKLHESWVLALKGLFRFYTPIVIGYGGNDGTLMKLLESLTPGEISQKMLWCYYEKGPAPTERIREVVSKHGGALVPVPSFDGLMIALGEDLGIGPLDTFIEQRAKSRVDRYRKRMEAKSTEVVDAAAATPPESSSAQVASAVKTTLEQAEGWWSWALKARGEKDPAKAEALYREAEQKYPNNADLLGDLAVFMKNVRKDYNQAETLYRRALELDPNNAKITGNFALFLADIRKDFDQAEMLYRRALELRPSDAHITGNFGSFQVGIRKDFDQAEKLFRRALELDPKNALHTSNFALFLAGARKDFDQAEKLFRRALELDPNNAVHTSNFAFFLASMRKDYDQAEMLYRRALELNPNDANITGDFAFFLAGIRKEYDQAEKLYQRILQLNPNDANITGTYAVFMHKVRGNYDQAEMLYRRTLELDPNRANTIGNFAVFMKNVRKDCDQAETLYRRAVELDPNDAKITGNFALFMTGIRKNYDQAEALFRRALELDPNDAKITGNFAVFMKNVRKDYDQAERLYRRALELDPNNANITGNFASLMAQVRKDYDQAEKLCRRALELDPNNADISGNLAYILLVKGCKEDALDCALKAWNLDYDPRSQVSAEAALYIGLIFLYTAKPDLPALGRLKTLLASGFERGAWDFSLLWPDAAKRISSEDLSLYKALAAAILDPDAVQDLDQYPRWKAVEAIPTDRPWNL